MRRDLAQSAHGYAAWKAAAEQACLAQPGVETVRLRPAIVYGAGRHALGVADGAAHPVRPLGQFGAAGEGICNLVHVADVAAAVAAALAAPAVAGPAFNVNGPEAITWNQWFARLAAAIGAPPLRPLRPLAGAPAPCRAAAEGAGAAAARPRRRLAARGAGRAAS